MSEVIKYDNKEITVNIRRDNTTSKEQYYVVLQNPYKDYHNTVVIFGSTEQIVKNKCIRQLKKWRKDEN